MDLTNLPANCVVLNDGAGDGPAKGKASAKQPEEEDGVPVPERRLFREERLQLRWKKVVPVGAGLKNIGNTCFLNAVCGTILYLTRHITLPAMFSRAPRLVLLTRCDLCDGLRDSWSCASLTRALGRMAYALMPSGSNA